jgi:two-component system NtrC family response regulator
MSEPHVSILLIEDDDLFRQAMIDYLSSAYRVTGFSSAHSGLEFLSKQNPELVLLDITLPGEDGVEVLRRIKQDFPEIPVIMLTAIDKISKVVECVKAGAYDYLPKPVIPEQLLSAVEQAFKSIEMKKALDQRKKLQLASNQEYRLLGISKQIQRVREEIGLVAKAETPVLLEGETGTGKEVTAREIHAASARASGPFVAINCAAIAKDLFESELFGHKKGAYTGAATGEIGKLQLAHNGTLCLDEISEMPLDLQSKLLRFLEDHEFYPVGSTDLVHVDVRIIASTNRNLEELVSGKMFREDLYYRLAVYTIKLPLLRDRPEDIGFMAGHFLQFFNQKFRKSFNGFAPDAERALQKHPWKGNVRELRNVLERAVLAFEGSEIQKDHLALTEAYPAGGKMPISIPEEGLDLDELEKSLLIQALQKTHGNKTKAAKLLHLTAPTFYYRLDKHGLGSEHETDRSESKKIDPSGPGGPT